MNRMDYGRSVVMVRVFEKRLLTKNKLERMIEAETPEEVAAEEATRIQAKADADAAAEAKAAKEAEQKPSGE